LLPNASLTVVVAETNEVTVSFVTVSAASSPMFVWHTAEDDVVPPEGSLRLGLSLINAGVPFRLSMFPYGPHGVALANDITRCGNDAWVQPISERWMDEADEWMRTVKTDY
jgi:endo-1,4-beta-xylanase